MPYIATKDGNSLYYYELGNGPAVVFVHGWIFGGLFWEYIVEDLASRGFRCVAYDRRGSGASSKPNDYRFDVLADDLASIIEELNLDDVTLVSHSTGSGDLVRYVSRYGGERVSRLVMLSPTLPYLLQSGDNVDGIPLEVFQAGCDAMKRDRPRYFYEQVPSFFGDPSLPGYDVSPALVDWAVAQALRSSLHASIALQMENVTTDFRSDVKNVRVPTLLIHGTADTFPPIEITAYRTHAAIARSRLIMYENAPHGLPLTHGARVAADILNFIVDTSMHDMLASEQRLVNNLP